jgi:aquaporin Z
MVEAGMCELLYTFMLCFVVQNVAVANKKQGPNQYYGLAIGFVIVAGAYGAGAVSGGCFNPAVAIGIDVSSAQFGVYWCAPYVVFELIGAALAAGLTKVVRPDEFGGDEISTVSRLTSEFIGTFILVLTVGLNVLGKSPAGAFSIAASLMCMIYALGNVSGANFNPAVSLAIFLSKLDPKFDATVMVQYMVAQILGGITAAFAYAGIHHGKTFPLGPGNGYGWPHVAVAEIVFTFVLCLVVLGAAVSDKTKTEQLFGFAIGSCVTVGGFAIGSISGGSLNPAVSFGIAASQIMNGGFFFKALIYSAFEFIGAGAAAGLVMITHAGTDSDAKKTDNVV